MSIGSQESATFIYRHFEDDLTCFNKRAPRGWNRVGEGAYRVVYLNKAEGVVYKIEQDYDPVNVDEAKYARLLSRRSTRKLGDIKVKIPTTRTYPVRSTTGERARVGAQQFVKGKYTMCSYDPAWNINGKCNCKQRLCHGVARMMISEWANLDDGHAGNIVIDPQGVYWILDMGEGT